MAVVWVRVIRLRGRGRTANVPIRRLRTKDRVVGEAEQVKEGTGRKILNPRFRNIAYSEYRRGRRARFNRIGGIKSIDGILLTDVAIERHSKAIELNPYFVEAYSCLFVDKGF